MRPHELCARVVAEFSAIISELLFSSLEKSWQIGEIPQTTGGQFSSLFLKRDKGWTLESINNLINVCRIDNGLLKGLFLSMQKCVLWSLTTNVN